MQVCTLIYTSFIYTMYALSVQHINWVYFWVIKAWNGVKPEVIIKSFKKCGISNAMDGTEDDAIFEQSDSSDDNDEELADKESDEEFNDFYD